MIGLDTNVIVRYLVHDDPRQTAVARKLFSSLSTTDHGFVSIVVVLELTRVVESVYNFTKDELIEMIELLLRSRELILEQREVVAQALRVFNGSRADFEHCLIERCCHASDCRYTVTFDRRAAAVGMRVLESR